MRGGELRGGTDGRTRDEEWRRGKPLRQNKGRRGQAGAVDESGKRHIHKINLTFTHRMPFEAHLLIIWRSLFEG